MACVPAGTFSQRDHAAKANCQPRSRLPHPFAASRSRSIRTDASPLRSRPRSRRPDRRGSLRADPQRPARRTEAATKSYSSCVRARRRKRLDQPIAAHLLVATSGGLGSAATAARKPRWALPCRCPADLRQCFVAKGVVRPAPAAARKESSRTGAAGARMWAIAIVGLSAALCAYDWSSTSPGACSGRGCQLAPA
jgi:hypothetical protein